MYRGGTRRESQAGNSIVGTSSVEAPMAAVTPEPEEQEELQTGLERLRQRRAELRDSMRALEQALAAPAPGRLDVWAERVHVAVVELAGDFTQHIDVTEGADGLYPGLLGAAPRLASAVDGLTREHGEITALVDELLACVRAPAAGAAETTRDLGTALLGRLSRHRQRGADLVYEAYQADIGGET
jgi:hypothetical protein